ncbi:uncharacterized protein LOC114672194 [Macaca mulatta]
MGAASCTSAPPPRPQPCVSSGPQPHPAPTHVAPPPHPQPRPTPRPQLRPHARSPAPPRARSPTAPPPPSQPCLAPAAPQPRPTLAAPPPHCNPAPLPAAPSQARARPEPWGGLSWRPLLLAPRSSDQTLREPSVSRLFQPSHKSVRPAAGAVKRARWRTRRARQDAAVPSRVDLAPGGPEDVAQKPYGPRDAGPRRCSAPGEALGVPSRRRLARPPGRCGERWGGVQSGRQRPAGARCRGCRGWGPGVGSARSR